MPDHLTAEQLATLSSYSIAGDFVGYYTYLQSLGDPYGGLALDVARADGLNGRIARGFASAIGQENGVALSGTDWAEISVRLMRRDFAARDDAFLNNRVSLNIPYQIIRDYHSSVFEQFRLPPAAWTAFTPLAIAERSGTADQLWQSFLTRGFVGDFLAGSGAALGVASNQEWQSLATYLAGFAIGGVPLAVLAAILDWQTGTSPEDTWLRNVFLRGAFLAGVGIADRADPFRIDRDGGGQIIGGTGDTSLVTADWLRQWLGLGQQNDAILGTSGNDVILGYSGRDTLDGTAGNDVIYGGRDDDTLIGGIGFDILHGGDADRSTWSGDGVDTAIYTTSISGITVVLGATAPDPLKGAIEISNDGLGGTDLLISVERVVGSAHADHVIVQKLDVDQLRRFEYIDLKGQPAGAVDTVDASTMAKAAQLVIVGPNIQRLAEKGNARSTTVEFRNAESFKLTSQADRVDIFVAPAGTVRFVDTGAGDDVVESRGQGIEFFLGADNDTISAGSGSIIHTGTGADEVQAGDNILITDLDSADKLLVGTKRVTGGVRFSGSESAWTFNGSLRMGLNHEGQLVVRLPNSNDPSRGLTFIDNPRVGPGDSDRTAGILLVEVEVVSYRFLGENPRQGTIGGTFHALLGDGLAAITGKPFSLRGDPLVLDLDGDGIELAAQIGSYGTRFDLDADGFAEPTGWAVSGDGLLARDENGNGRIDHVGELFGTQTMSGFAELATWDSNADLRIDAADGVWSSLRVWVDANRDGLTDPGELQTMDEAGVRSISLLTTSTSTTQAGNLIEATGQFVRTDGTVGAIADVTFLVNNYDSTWLGDPSVSAEAAALPGLKGHGTLRDLRVAMTQDAGLLATVAATIPALTSHDLTSLRQAAAPIFAAWAAPDTATRPTLPMGVSVDSAGRKTVLDFGIPPSQLPGGGGWRLARTQRTTRDDDRRLAA